MNRREFILSGLYCLAAYGLPKGVSLADEFGTWSLSGTIEGAIIYDNDGLYWACYPCPGLMLRRDSESYDEFWPEWREHLLT